MKMATVTIAALAVAASCIGPGVGGKRRVVEFRAQIEDEEGRRVARNGSATIWVLGSYQWSEITPALFSNSSSEEGSSVALRLPILLSEVTERCTAPGKLRLTVGGTRYAVAVDGASWGYREFDVANQDVVTVTMDQ